MTATPKLQSDTVLYEEILGSRRFSNYLWATISAIGGIGFLLAGISSYLKINLLIVSNTTGLPFVPQGVALTFYGVVGSLVSLYLWLMILWDVGGGYNKFDKQTERATIFRWGFPGKNRRIQIDFSLEDIQAVRAEIKEGINPKRSLYLRVKKRRDIPLTRVGQPVSLTKLENQGATLARFLQVPLEGL